MKQIIHTSEGDPVGEYDMKRPSFSSGEFIGELEKKSGVNLCSHQWIPYEWEVDYDVERFRRVTSLICGKCMKKKHI